MKTVTTQQDDLAFLNKRVTELVNDIEYRTKNAERIFAKYLDEVMDEKFVQIKANSRLVTFAIKMSRECMTNNSIKLDAFIEVIEKIDKQYAENHRKIRNDLETRILTMEQRITG